MRRKGAFIDEKEMRKNEYKEMDGTGDNQTAMNVQ